ncbi:small subunit ribosomal protein S28e, partial [Pancytospora epiphaga]
ISPDDVAYIAEVVNVYNKCGVGGDITLCRVMLRHNNRAIVRAIMGPVRVGDLVSLRECVRESRGSR